MRTKNRVLRQKSYFTPKCCARATAQQLIHALVARLLAIIGARSSRYMFAFCLASSQLAAASSKVANLSQSSPGTEALQRYESSASRLAVHSPTPESSDRAMSRLRIRERVISYVGLAPSKPNVCAHTPSALANLYQVCAYTVGYGL